MNYELIPLPEFERQAKRPQKKYRHLKDDLLTLRQVLLANPRAGNAIPGILSMALEIILSRAQKFVETVRQDGIPEETAYLFGSWAQGHATQRTGIRIV